MPIRYPQPSRHPVLRRIALIVLLSMLAACDQALPPQPAPATSPTTDTSTVVPPPPAPTTDAPETMPTLTTAAPTAVITPTAAGVITTYLPFIGEGGTVATLPAILPTATPAAAVAAPPPTAVPTVALDFAAVRAQLAADGQQIAYNKIGFHVGNGGNAVGLGDWMRTLDAAGVPFFLKSVDNAGALVEAQALARASGVPHTLVYRSTGNDVPDYNLPPEEAARQHWAWHMARFPRELDRELVWLETMNELDKNRSTWLARFALEQARLAARDGVRWAAFGWAAGEPEPEHWQLPEMLELLRLIGNNPDRYAIAIHEGSLRADGMSDAYPYKVGRFLALYAICDANDIPRPTLLITEWGWQSHDMPEPGPALEQIRWAAGLYARYPQVKGAAIWYLGGGFDPIADKAQRLIAPLTALSLNTYFALPADTPLSADPAAYPAWP